jgi:hypothetical protein
MVIDENAFTCCSELRQVPFAAGSELQYISADAFSPSSPWLVFLAVSATEVGLSAFFAEVWRIVTLYTAEMPVAGLDDRGIPIHIAVMGKPLFR